MYHTEYRMSNTEGASAETDEKRSETARVCTFFKRSGRQGGGGRRKRPIQRTASDDDAGMHHWRIQFLLPSSNMHILSFYLIWN